MDWTLAIPPNQSITLGDVSGTGDSDHYQIGRTR
jgi:hypothetical protein